MNESKPLILAHEAMTTSFELHLAHADETYARQAAVEAFRELDQLEARLSRFAESSDIYRINRLSRDQFTVVHLDTFECLKTALQIQAVTGGTFDVTYASSSPAPTPGGARFELNETDHTVRSLVEGLRVDLGAIGKGFALDRMAELLEEWEIKSALLCASVSTVLALDPPPGKTGWPITFGPEKGNREIHLCQMAFSGSGKAVKGEHIVDPHTKLPAEGCFRCWSGAPTGAWADALSTAFMVMGPEKTKEFCDKHGEFSAFFLKSEDAPLVTVADRLK